VPGGVSSVKNRKRRANKNGDGLNEKIDEFSENFPHKLPGVLEGRVSFCSWGGKLRQEENTQR